MIKVEIFDGDIGSVQNRINKWFSDNTYVSEILSVTQSSPEHRMIVITIIYKDNREQNLEKS